MKTVHQILLTLLVSLAIGCASDPKQENDPEFGDSVRNMVMQQTFNATAANDPPAGPPLGLDGARAGATFKAYREDVRKPSVGGRPVEVQVVE